MSEMMFGEPNNVRRVKGADNGKFLRTAPDRSDSEGPRNISNAAFSRYMGESEKADGPTRLQSMRKKFGWKALRPRWWNQNSRDYQSAWKAEQLRFRGIGSKLEDKARTDIADETAAAKTAPVLSNRESSESDVESLRPSLKEARSASEKEASSRDLDRRVVDKYSDYKGQLKGAAGWGRFLPFSGKRAAYKRARQELRTGYFTPAGMGKFAARMPEVIKNQRHKEEGQYREVAELQALLGPQGGGDSASGGLKAPPEGVDADLWRQSRAASAELDAPDDDDAESIGGRPPSFAPMAIRARQVSEEEPNRSIGMGRQRRSSDVIPDEEQERLQAFEQMFLRDFLEEQNKDDD